MKTSQKNNVAQSPAFKSRKTRATPLEVTMKLGLIALALSALLIALCPAPRVCCAPMTPCNDPPDPVLDAPQPDENNESPNNENGRALAEEPPAEANAQTGDTAFVITSASLLSLATLAVVVRKKRTFG